MIDRLHQIYPDAGCSLDFTNAYQLLVATILSAQCTDARVNLVTPRLFSKYPDLPKLSEAKISDLETIIRSTGFYRNKARNLILMAQTLTERDPRGLVPETMEELSSLPGVGRKTANVVLGNAFQKPAGMVVDTHVKRLSYRMGLTKQKDPEKIEKDLNRLLDPKDWVMAPHLLIAHGRAVCTARSPRCGDCPLKTLCPQRGLARSRNSGI